MRKQPTSATVPGAQSEKFQLRPDQLMVGLLRWVVVGCLLAWLVLARFMVGVIPWDDVCTACTEVDA